VHTTLALAPSNVAVIVVTPVLVPVTMPVSLTVAAFVFAEDQRVRGFEVTSCFGPSDRTGAAASCAESPRPSAQTDGDTAIADALDEARPAAANAATRVAQNATTSHCRLESRRIAS
jgi:hypothetical protein